MACSINHSMEDVVSKLESQKEFLPSDIYQGVGLYLKKPLSQEILNEIFHLLKKYDLAGEAEQQERNEVLRTMIKS
ncbi:group-specific protein [Bacillus sp. Marseille-P3661]|uniref:group-specific protein n=1 Tax=Bacillus sp. Marseille-P3661 TaxID=1936234 RepID=UPI000C8240B1|nr:group-specific protein [Bacillus sp. Marseille-P3661]